jgi:hypothetical protein
MTAERSADERLAFSLGIHVGGIKEIDAAVARSAQEVEKPGCVSLEYPPDPSAAEAKFRDPEVSLAEWSRLQRSPHGSM